MRLVRLHLIANEEHCFSILYAGWRFQRKGEPVTKRRSLAVSIVCFLTFIAGELQAQKLAVIDAGGHSAVITTSQIASLPRVTAEVSEHGATSRYEGVALSAVLAASGVQLGDTLRGARMTECLLVEGSDGYKVAFALAEIDPAFATREIILADKRDGKPLDAKEGPFRAVTPGDKRGARWVRQVTTLRVVSVQ
jgi:hypothetical protein